MFAQTQNFDEKEFRSIDIKNGAGQHTQSDFMGMTYGTNRSGSCNKCDSLMSKLESAEKEQMMLR